MSQAAYQMADGRLLCISHAGSHHDGQRQQAPGHQPCQACHPPVLAAFRFTCREVGPAPRPRWPAGHQRYRCTLRHQPTGAAKTVLFHMDPTAHEHGPTLSMVLHTIAMDATYAIDHPDHRSMADDLGQEPGLQSANTYRACASYARFLDACGLGAHDLANELDGVD